MTIRKKKKIRLEYLNNDYSNTSSERMSLFTLFKPVFRDIPVFKNIIDNGI